jgi:hypothetical protein
LDIFITIVTFLALGWVLGLISAFFFLKSMCFYLGFIKHKQIPTWMYFIAGLNKPTSNYVMENTVDKAWDIPWVVVWLAFTYKMANDFAKGKLTEIIAIVITFPIAFMLTSLIPGLILWFKFRKK